MNPAVAVVGSANLDLVAHAATAPEAGETVLGDELSMIEGGKGANQAIAAAAIATTTFVGCLGHDDAGRRLLSNMRDAGVRTDQLVYGERASGHALITVSHDGENRIVVVPGANHELTPAQTDAALTAAAPSVVLSQLEIPLESVLAAARWARAHGAVFLLNPSPMCEIPAELIELSDVLLVNMGEARALLASISSDHGLADLDAAALAQALGTAGRTVIVTAGSAGVSFAEPDHGIVHIPAERIEVVDTTGAGDAFAGTLAALLAQGNDLEHSVRRANIEAARVVSLPRSARRESTAV